MFPFVPVLGGHLQRNTSLTGTNYLNALGKKTNSPGKKQKVTLVGPPYLKAAASAAELQILIMSIAFTDFTDL